MKKICYSFIACLGAVAIYCAVTTPNDSFASFRNGVANCDAGD